jgi:hypothetical protein
MGNCNPWKASFVIDDVEPREAKTAQLEQAPIRYGAQGLFDCGFEYRQVSSTISDELDLPETRLFHITSGVMITPGNRKTYIPDGPIFDRVVQCCQQIAQQRLQSQYGLEWVNLFSLDGEPINALASPDYANDPEETRPILMVFTGKGKSRAGILSVRELMVSGLERGSAIYHIHQAMKRRWSVIVFDINARGKTEGMSLVRRSLDNLNWNEPSFVKHPIYILSHSAAGGYLVHYLLESDQRQKLLSSINGVAFTDSTHNIQWAKDDKPVAEFLESQRTLYIRNCSENPSDTFADHKNKKAGEAHEGNRFWYRRFGNIPTVWAGTTDHSAMCWVARKVVWDFFDKRNEQSPRAWTWTGASIQ